MMHLKPIKGATADLSNFSGIIASKENRIISLTKLVLAISILFAVLMVVSK